MILTSIRKFMLSHYTWVTRIFAIAAVCVVLGVIIYGAKKPPRISQLDPITTVIEVPVEKLTTKTVTEYVRVEDRTAVDRLMRDNAALKSTVQQLTVSLAEATSHGAGTVVVTTPDPTTNEPTIIKVPMTLQFKDWRLEFQSDGVTAHYTLSQKFSILNTVGRTDTNTPVNIVRLFEIGANGERLPIPTVETTIISAQPTRDRFYMKPTLQAGVGILPRWDSTATPTTTGGRTRYDTSLAVAVPWWKRGRTTAVEDTRYAYLTPVVTINDTELTGGLAPISVNLGTLRYSPVTDLWFSPYAGLSSRHGKKKFAVVFTTTF